ncbi:MAG: GerW family sporulation protein [Oscillospiraceae bacterium]|nr:GerW family sporulation protein [Oscillospiraceae bacterium]
MEKHQISELMETTMQKVREMVDANTIIGQPIITQDGITLIPVSKVTFGFAGGGSDFAKKATTAPANFGGGAGAGVNIIPVAFIVVKNDNVRLLHVSPPGNSTVDRIIDTVPDIIDKVTDFMDKNKGEGISGIDKLNVDDIEKTDY